MKKQSHAEMVSALRSLPSLSAAVVLNENLKTLANLLEDDGKPFNAQIVREAMALIERLAQETGGAA